MSQTAAAMSLVDFLKLPERKPAREYIDGEVVPKVSPTAKHGRLQLWLGRTIGDAAEPERHGMVFPELRCTFAGRSLVFDLAYFQWNRIVFGPDGELADDVYLPPDWLIEILSPGQTIRAMSQRLGWCLRHGVRLGWLVIPRSRSIRIFQPGEETVLVEGRTMLTAGDVLPGFRVAADAIFACLRAPGG